MSEGLTQSAVLSNPSSNGNNCALTQPTTWKTIVEAVQTKGPQKPKLSKISCFPISNYNFSLPLPLCILLHSLISQSRQRTLALAWETDVDIFCVILLFVFTEFSQLFFIFVRANLLPFFRNFKKIQSYLFSTEFGLQPLFFFNGFFAKTFLFRQPEVSLKLKLIFMMRNKSQQLYVFIKNYNTSHPARATAFLVQFVLQASSLKKPMSYKIKRCYQTESDIFKFAEMIFFEFRFLSRKVR